MNDLINTLMNGSSGGLLGSALGGQSPTPPASRPPFMFNPTPNGNISLNIGDSYAAGAPSNPAAPQSMFPPMMRMPPPMMFPYPVPPPMMMPQPIFVQFPKPCACGPDPADMSYLQTPVMVTKPLDECALTQLDNYYYNMKRILNLPHAETMSELLLKYLYKSVDLLMKYT